MSAFPQQAPHAPARGIAPLFPARAAIDIGSSICDFRPITKENNRRARDPMDTDVELMRDLLFVLEDYQTSPRSVIIVSADVEAERLERPVAEIEAGLATLLDFEYIDGPGPDEPGFFLFRKLTRKGLHFVEATRNPRDWDRMKRHFAEKRLEWDSDPQ